MMKRSYFLFLMMAAILMSACGTTDKQEASDTNTIEVDETTLEGEGLFVGLVDATSLEVETNDGPLILRYSEEQSTKVSSIPEGQKVKYTYTKNVEKQNILQTIEEL